jgi:phytoene dehydrogenase-like protein
VCARFWLAVCTRRLASDRERARVAALREWRRDHHEHANESVGGLADIVLCDTTPLLPFPQRGPGIFKIDYALAAPVPWTAEACRHAGTVHVGGSFEDIAASEAAIAYGAHAERPFVLVTQPSLFDDTRAPAGKHTLWLYCHVPNGSNFDMTERIEAQIERFAPGFRDVVLARSSMRCRDVESHNSNYVGGDISGGFRAPSLQLDPYSTAVPNVFLCSAATPPGPGVHGMCGFHAAERALKRLRLPAGNPSASAAE